MGLKTGITARAKSLPFRVTIAPPGAAVRLLQSSVLDVREAQIGCTSRYFPVHGGHIEDRERLVEVACGRRRRSHADRRQTAGRTSDGSVGSPAA